MERSRDGKARRNDDGCPMNEPAHWATCPYKNCRRCAQERDCPAYRGEAIQVGVPREGFYKVRLVNSGMWVAVRIWYGQPIIDAETQDRSPRWCAEVDGRTDRFDKEAQHRVPLDALEVWPFAAGHPITRNEYGFLRKRAAWAREHAPEHPAANPHQPINLRRLPPVTP
jgi:hypothetical protein